MHANGEAAFVSPGLESSIHGSDVSTDTSATMSSLPQALTNMVPSVPSEQQNSAVQTQDVKQQEPTMSHLPKTKSLKRPARNDDVDDENAPYDKSHFPEYVQFGDQVMHRDSVPDDIAQLIDMLGVPVAAQQTSGHAQEVAEDGLLRPKKSEEGAEWQPDSSTEEASSSSDDSSDSDSDVSSDEDENEVGDNVTEAQVHTENRAASTRVEQEIDSESDDDDADDGIELLNPYEQARILMADTKDDDSGPPRTKNEVVQKVIKPQVEMTPDEPISQLGTIQTIVENFVLVTPVALSGGRILEAGSVLCTADRKIIGGIDDHVGRVDQPHYSVAFSSSKEIVEEGLEIGTSIFYVDRHSQFTSLQPLWAHKGTDASGEYDEEGVDDVYFSDDEKEAEYRRDLQMMKAVKKLNQQDVAARQHPDKSQGNSRGKNRRSRNNEAGRGRGHQSRGGRGGPRQRVDHEMSDAPSYPSQPINYDDDAPYVKLERPNATNNSASSHQRGNPHSRGGRNRGGNMNRAPSHSTPVQNQYTYPFPGQQQQQQLQPQIPTFPPMPPPPPGSFINPAFPFAQPNQQMPPPLPPFNTQQYMPQPAPMPWIPPPPPMPGVDLNKFAADYLANLQRQNNGGGHNPPR